MHAQFNASMYIKSSLLTYMCCMQDSIPESDRGVVGGVQNSLQSCMDLLSYVMGIIVSNPQVSFI
jgi:hypothetical protein